MLGPREAYLQSSTCIKILDPMIRNVQISSDKMDKVIQCLLRRLSAHLHILTGLKSKPISRFYRERAAPHVEGNEEDSWGKGLTAPGIAEVATQLYSDCS